MSSYDVVVVILYKQTTTNKNIGFNYITTYKSIKRKLSTLLLSKKKFPIWKCFWFLVDYNQMNSKLRAIWLRIVWVLFHWTRTKCIIFLFIFHFNPLRYWLDTNVKLAALPQKLFYLIIIFFLVNGFRFRKWKYSIVVEDLINTYIGKKINSVSKPKNYFSIQWEKADVPTAIYLIATVRRKSINRLVLFMKWHTIGSENKRNRSTFVTRSNVLAFNFG